jgi:hypothetical protein
MPSPTRIKAVKLQSLEVEGSGHTAYEVGRYTLQDEEGQVLDTGKDVVIWKHEADQWKAHRDTWNSRRPAPGESDGTTLPLRGRRSVGKEFPKREGVA